MLPCRKSRDVALGSLAVKVLRLEELLAAREAQLAAADESGQEWLADAHKLRQAVGDTLAVLGEPQHEHQHVGLGHGRGAVEPVNAHLAVPGRAMLAERTVSNRWAAPHQVFTAVSWVSLWLLDRSKLGIAALTV